jgi:hypothetical protein
MDAQQAVRFIDRLLDREQQRKLNDLESTIVLQSWEGITYQSIAARLSYEPDYIKQVAARLWKLLSQLLGENICKGNIRSVLDRHQRPRSIANWHEPDEIYFEDKTEANVWALENWMVGDSCHSIVFFKLSESNKIDRKLGQSDEFASQSYQIQAKQRQLKNQIKDSILQNLSLAVDSQMFVNNILSQLKEIDINGTEIDCLIIMPSRALS